MAEDSEGRIIPGGKGRKDVTVVVSRNVYPGHEQEYDEWVRKLVAAAKESPGNRGVTMLIPPPGQSGLYHVVLRFADEKSVHQWETSYIRQKLSHEADAFSRRSRQEATGLETWFSIPECPELETPPLSERSLVRSSTGTSVMPVASTASCTTSIRELADMSFCSFQARMKRE